MKMPFMRQLFMRQISWYLVIAILMIGIAQHADAGFISPEINDAASRDRASDIESIQKIIDTKMIKDRLEQLGYTGEDIRSRLEALSDREIHEIAGNLDGLRFGGDTLGIIIISAIIAIIAVIIYNITGQRAIVIK